MNHAPRSSHFGESRGRSIKRIFKPGLRVRLSALLARAAPQPSQNALDRQLEDVREIMLSHLGLGQILLSSIFRRIQYATDIQVLWYLRSDLMVALASAHGETMARREMTDITRAFQDALPVAMRYMTGSRRP